MNETTWTEVESSDAKLVGDSVDLSDEARALLEEGLSSEEYYGVLRKAALWTDAVRFLAAALPARATVHWAVSRVRAAIGEDGAEEDLEALRLAEEWLVDPAEETRYAAFAAADKQGFDSPAAWAAVSAHWSGPSLSPPEAPVVPPPPGLPAKASSGALLLLAAAEPRKMEKHYAAFLEFGGKLARGEEELPELRPRAAVPEGADEASTPEEGR